MMSLIDLDDDQRWVPTHVNVTVLRARGLRTKGKHGSRYLYTIVQVGKEKYTTGLVEKAAMPEWHEEFCFELLPGILEAGGRGDYPPGSGDLVLTVMHRVLIGLDVFLGQAIVPLDKIFDEGMCPRDEWLRLHSRAGRKEKERGELQTTVRFTRNNMTASMFDLTLKDKPRSAFGKLKDRVTGRKGRGGGDVTESSSAIVPGRFAALSGSPGQPFGEGGGGGGEEITRDTQQAPEEKRSKMKDFFKGKLRRSDDTRSCSSLASESSMSSVASENPPPSLDLLADPPSSPIYSPKVKVDSHYGDTDLAKKVLTTQHTTKVLTHKRAFSDEASRITTAAAGAPRPHPAVESIMGHQLTQSKSSLCINGSHVYDSEPCTPNRNASPKLVLLEKCSPLSRSLQNLTKRGGGGSEDKGSSSPAGEGRRWSFDKGKKEDTEEVQSARIGASCPAAQQPVSPLSAAAVSPPDKGKKTRKTLFSTGGRSDSLPAKSEQQHHGQAGSWAPEGRLRGWFGSGDSQNKPRLEGSPKVESSSDEPAPPLPPRSPIHHAHPPSPLPSPSPSPTHIPPPESHRSHRANNNTNPFATPSPSPSPTPPPISPSNPFLPRMQRNPFFVELIAEESRRSPPLLASSSGSPLPHCTALPSSSSRPCVPIPSPLGPAPAPKRVPSIRRERPRAVARQASLPAVLPRPVAPPGSLGHFTPRSVSDSGGEQWDDSFDAFASSRLSDAPTGAPRHQEPSKAQRRGNPPDGERLEPPAPQLPPRRPPRSMQSEMYSSSWLHRGQELAVQKEACLLSQTGAASRQRAREEEQQRKRSTPSSASPSPDPPASSETSESLGSRPRPEDAGLTSSSGLATDSDHMKKFRYEPLEDDTPCWKGMLFEQDLYGRIGSTGSYGEPRVNDALLSVAPEEPAGNQIASKSKAPSQKADITTRPKMLLNSELTVADLLSMSADVMAPKSNSKALGIAPVTLEPVIYSPPVHPPQQPTSANDNISYSLTLEDLNMNVNNCLDFSFIDSEGSSPSETTADTLRGLKDLGESFPPPPEDSHVAVYHEGPLVTPENMLALKHITSETNSSRVDMSVSPDKMWPVSPVSEEDTSENLFSSSELETEPRPVRLKGEEEFRQTDGTFDGNGNTEVKLQATSHNQIGSSSFSGVLSARLRPKGANQEVCGGGSPCSQSKKGNDKPNGLSHPVRRISESGEGPLSYQPANSSHSSSLTLDKESTCVADSSKPVICPSETHSIQSILNKTDTAEASSLGGQTAFEDLHASVAPNVTPSKSKIGQSLQDPAPPPPPSSSSVSIPSAAAALLSQSSDSINAPPPTNHRHPHHPAPPDLHPLATRSSADTTTTTTTTTTTALAVTLVRSALSSSSSSSSYSSSSTAQSLVDARHTLLPEERQPAISCYLLPLQESSPHPVKPLTSTSTQPEKKEGRSVLEKLKSTIHPGRAAQQSTATEADKNQEATATTVDQTAQYQSMTNMELISLLLQQEMDLQKQQASSEGQAALLSKRDAELRKVKTQVRDLEDYIDNLLLRIMEQTPTLLQVRGIARHK